jgi:very-short-patch-repair endonuclease
MGTKSVQSWAGAAWELARRQHWVVTRGQLLALGASSEEVRGLSERGRLHALWPGVYAVGRPDVGRTGLYRGATLACGPDARLAGLSAADLYGLRAGGRGGRGRRPRPVPPPAARHPGTPSHPPSGAAPQEGIPLDDPVTVLVDLAAALPDEEVEDAVNAADRLGLVPTPRLRRALGTHPRRRGRDRLISILDAQTFSRSQSVLERRFLSLVRESRLPLPASQRRIGRHRVDFHYPDHGLVVECDSLRHHRTAASQTRDLERDQAHARAGLRILRFTHLQVFRRPAHAETVLAETLGVRRLAA